MAVRTFTAALAAGAALSGAAAAQEADLTCKGGDAFHLDVRVTGVKSDSGLIAVTVYGDDSSKFLRRHGSIGTVRVSAKTPTTHVCVAMPKAGRYALAVYHDLNADHKLNMNLLWPAEPFALSNNPPVKLAFPALGPSLFSVRDGDNAITVSLTNPKDVKDVKASQSEAK